ncbi:hypothetical protein GQ457_01G023730 [Hibiscus cannabinus]
MVSLWAYSNIRHLYSNAKTSGVFIGKALKDKLWKATRATYVTQFQSAIDELKKLNNATSLAHSCWPLHVGGQMYQVSCDPSSQHSINIQEWTYLCKKWQLTCIPSIHVISVILSIEDRPEKYVDPCYSVSTQREIYSHLISPVRGEQQWANDDTMEPILPPIFRRPQEDHIRKEKERLMKHHL